MQASSGVLGLVALIAIIAGAASGGSKTPAVTAPVVTAPAIPAVAATATTASAQTAAQTVTYEVTGSDASVTYGPAGSDLSGTVPMKVTKPLGDPLYYSVTAQLQGGGSVTAEILVNGKVVSKAEASGGYNIAMAEISQDPLTGGWQSDNG